MEDSWFINQNTVNLSGFVTLTLAEFVTPQQRLHRLVMNRKGYVFQFDSCRHRVSLSNIRSMAQLRAVVSMWCALVKVALNRRTDVLILIRIRIVIHKPARFARSPSQHFVHGVTQCCAVCYIVARRKGSERSERRLVFFIPLWGN